MILSYDVATAVIHYYVVFFCHCFPLGWIEMTLTCVGILLLDFLHCILGYISHDLHDTRLRGSFNRRFRYLRRDYMCSADTMISALQIPLQLKLLYPWNRGIHGYIRSFCVSLFIWRPHLFPHSSFRRPRCTTSRFLTAPIWFSQKKICREHFD